MAISINTYQKWTYGTVNYKKDYELMYVALGLAGEAGEVANKIKKVYRDNDGIVTNDNIEDIKLELGDVLWYLVRLADEIGIKGQEIINSNIEKIMDRKARGVLGFTGDKL